MSKVPASRKTNRSTPAAFPFDKTFLTSSLMRRYSFVPGLQSPQCMYVCIQDMNECNSTTTRYIIYGCDSEYFYSIRISPPTNFVILI